MYIIEHAHIEICEKIGSFKLQVSFAEYSLFYRALLPKRPVILGSLLIVANPYVYVEISQRITHQKL